VQPIATKLAAANGLKQKFVSRVLRMPLNALALPYKTIVVAQSLVDFCRDERDQMAFVVAHEMAHIHLGHASDRSRANAVATAFRFGNPLLGAGLRMMLDRAFSREQEFEADRTAAIMCANAGYDPAAGGVFLARLAKLDQSTGVWQILSTHPPMGERVAQIRNTVREIGKRK
jgi:Zn-dependent protease with chaperone function